MKITQEMGESIADAFVESLEEFMGAKFANEYGRVAFTRALFGTVKDIEKSNGFLFHASCDLNGREMQRKVWKERGGQATPKRKVSTRKASRDVS